MTVRLAETPFDPVAALAEFSARAPDAGAVVSCLGKVRAVAEGAPVEALILDHYPGPTERSIEEIVRRARARWRLDDVLVIHRVGTMAPGEAIVLVCAAAAHRREAFEAADFMMDCLKTEALFWKQERTGAGARWIEPRAADYRDAERWGRE